jgi:hypothetical protein
VPGAGSGLLVRKRKNLKEGKKIVVVEEWSFDGAILSDLKDSLKQATIEVGDWEDKHRINTDDRGPAYSHLTDEQLAEEIRILRETQDKLDALHAGKPIPRLIEAAPGSVQSGPEIEVDPRGGSGVCVETAKSACSEAFRYIP